MRFLRTVVAWVVLDLMLIVAGGFLGAMASTINPLNDFGTTGATYGLVGIMLGSSLAIAFLLRRNEKEFAQRCESRVTPRKYAVRLILEAVAWGIVNVVLVISGSLGAFVTASTLDRENTRGVTWAVAMIIGALSGSSLTIVVLLSLNKLRIKHWANMLGRAFGRHQPQRTFGRR